MPNEAQEFQEEELEVVDQEVEQDEQVETPDYSDVELEAMQHGWNPEGVEGKRNLTAEEFMDRQKLYDDIRHLKRQNKKIADEFEALQKHHTKVREKEREKLLNELKIKKKLAYEAEDFDSVIDIDEEIAELKNEKPEEKPAVNNEVFDEWAEKNSWYNTDKELRDEAEILGHGYMAANQGKASFEDMLEYVEKKIKQMFPDKFTNTRRNKPSPVDKSTRSTQRKTSSKYSAKDLPDEDRKIMNTLVRAGAITEEQYLKEYFE